VRTHRSLPAIVTLLLACASGDSVTETLECTPIATLPAVITQPGIYCLTDNLNTAVLSGNAIWIQTNNVTIDLNGWKLGRLAAGTNTNTYGIYALDRKNITIRNGTVRGFFEGIYLAGANGQGNLIEDVRAEQNTFTDIHTDGRGDVIRRNQVVDTGGSTIQATIRYGIIANGAGARVLDNDVVGVTGSSLAAPHGVYLNAASGATVEGNRISEISADEGNVYGPLATGCDNIIIEANRVSGVSSTAGLAYGVYLNQLADALVSTNRISGTLDNGLYFASASGGYADNKVIGATTPYFGGTSYLGNSP